MTNHAGNRCRANRNGRIYSPRMVRKKVSLFQSKLRRNQLMMRFAINQFRAGIVFYKPAKLIAPPSFHDIMKYLVKAMGEPEHHQGADGRTHTWSFKP